MSGISGAFKLMNSVARAAGTLALAEHKARAAALFRRETKFFEDGVQVNGLNYLMTLDRVVASRGGIPLIE